MSSQIEEILHIVAGKGSNLRLFVDHAKSETSIEHNWAEFSFDGEEHSDLFVVPNHWHKEHDEFMEVLEGRMLFNLNGKEMIVSAGDSPLYIQRGVVHGLATIKGVPCRFRERTQPAGLHKALFFQDLFQSGGLPGFLLAMRIFYDGDTYVPLPGGFRTVDYVFMSVVGFIAKAFVPGKSNTIQRKK